MGKEMIASVIGKFFYIVHDIVLTVLLIPTFHDIIFNDGVFPIFNDIILNIT